MKALHSAIPSVLEGRLPVNVDAFSMVLFTADESMNYSKQFFFFLNKMRCFSGEEPNLLQQHQATTAGK